MSRAAKTPPPDLAVPQTQEELQELRSCAQLGDPRALPAVRQMLTDPANIALLGGELTETVIQALAKALSENDLALREAVVRKTELLRAELLGDNPTLVERLLVEQLTSNWLQVQEAELRYAQNARKANSHSGIYYQQLISAATRRFLAAVKALMLVRKSAAPAVQVNVAQQVNAIAPADG